MDNDLLIFWERTLRPGSGGTGLPACQVFSKRVEEVARRLPACSLLASKALAIAQRELTRLLAGLCGRAQSAGSGLSKYPVLERLVAQCEDDWVQAYSEFISRLDSRVVHIEPALSDRHHGRTVIAVTFASGERLIYKPRDMALERSYFELLEWLNRDGAPAQQRVVKITEKDGYGWAEAIPQLPCRGRESARAYYFRAGGLHCLLYVLNATDAHMGNVIANGNAPVLVDAECVIQPRWPAAIGTRGAAAIEDLVHSGLLPRPESLRGGEVDLSGLTGAAGQVTNYRVPLWEGRSFRFVAGVLLAQRNLPRRRAALKRYGDAFLAGFGEMHRYLAGRRDRLPLEQMLSHSPRVLLKHTRYYLSLLNRSLDPRWLRDPARRSRMLRETLARETGGRLHKGVLEAEASAIERLDLPYFTARGTTLVAGGMQPIPNYFPAPAEQVVRCRLRELNNDSLDSQLRVLRFLIALSD